MLKINDWPKRPRGRVIKDDDGSPRNHGRHSGGKSKKHSSTQFHFWES